MRKWEREIRHTVESLGLHVDRFDVTGGVHYKLLLRHDDGRTMHLIAAQSPSDRKAALNMRARIRRHFELGKKYEGESRSLVRDGHIPRQ